LIRDDLIDYVNRQLFPYLQGFKQRATSPDTIEYKIGEIFSEIKNKFQSGYSLRDALEYIDELRFRSQKKKYIPNQNLTALSRSKNGNAIDCNCL